MEFSLLLIISFLALLFVLNKIVDYKQSNSKLQEVKSNINNLFWGIMLVVIIILIPYSIWKMTGSSNNWNGLYIIAISAIGTILFCFGFVLRTSNSNDTLK